MYYTDENGVEHRTLPAAALGPWDVVLIPGRDEPFTIAKVYHTTPDPGSITWVDEAGLEEVVGGSQKIEILALSTTDNPHPSPGVIR